MENKQLVTEAVKVFFNSLSQIMLQENPFTGMLFLAGIFCGSLTMGLAAIVAIISSNLIAVLLKFPSSDITKGLYGFSAVLTAVALILFFQASIVVWLFVVIGAVMAALIQHFFISRNIPGYTFPFILVTWALLFLLPHFPQLAMPTIPPITTGKVANYGTIIHGFGQVIFQGGIWAGILFITGMLIANRTATLFGIISAVISGVLAYGLGETTTAIYDGLLSYNAVLCAITFAGRHRTNLIFAFIAVVLSTLLMIQMGKLHLPALTFPFVLASWLVLVIKMLSEGPAVFGSKG